MALLWWLLASAVHAQPVSLADLARHPEYSSVKISPDGQFLAAASLVRGQRVLALIRLSDKKGHVIQPRFHDDLIDFWWASAGRVVYTVGHHVGGYDSPLATGELFAVNADGQGAKLLYGAREGGQADAEIIAPIADQPYYALVSISPWDSVTRDGEISVAYRMDVRNGAIMRIVAAPARNLSFVADHHGHIRFAFGEDNDGKPRNYQLSSDGKTWQPLPTEGIGKVQPLAFSQDDSVAYFSCEPSSVRFGVCAWNAASKTWKTIWSHAEVEADGLLHGMSEDEILGVGFTDGRPGIALLDQNSASARSLVALMQQFPGENVRFVSGTRDGRLSVVLVDADVDPGTFYLFDRDARKLTPLLSETSWIDPARMASKQPFEFSARDGRQLQGYVSYPPGLENATHLPMVVYVHGGPYGVRDNWDYDSYVQALATRGYAVLQVNFRGSGGYGDAFVRAGWGEWGGRMQDDVTDATRWAIAQGIADAGHLCIFGGSYGGYAALEGAVKEPDLYRCAIGYVGVYDLALMYQRGDIPQSTGGENYLKRVLGSDKKLLAQRSPINQLDRLKASVMLVVGGKDERVPPIQGRRLNMILSRRNIPHVWLEKPDEMHGFYGEANVAELYTKLVQFVASSIGPGAMVGKSASAAPVHSAAAGRAETPGG
jgi:dipeptidyl aminopeptidase/acylaminoacyl peptidase